MSTVMRHNPINFGYTKNQSRLRPCSLRFHSSYFTILMDVWGRWFNNFDGRLFARIVLGVIAVIYVIYAYLCIYKLDMSTSLMRVQTHRGSDKLISWTDNMGSFLCCKFSVFFFYFFKQVYFVLIYFMRSFYALWGN